MHNLETIFWIFFFEISVFLDNNAKETTVATLAVNTSPECAHSHKSQQSKTITNQIKLITKMPMLHPPAFRFEILLINLNLQPKTSIFPLLHAFVFNPKLNFYIN